MVRHWQAAWVAFLGILLLNFAACGHTYTTHFDHGGDAWSSVKRVAVLPLDNLTETPDAGEVLGSLLMTELQALGRFSVVGKLEMQKTLEEKNVRMPAIMDRVAAAEIGRRLNCDAVVIGSVLEFSYRADKDTDEMEPVVALNLRVVSVRTGTVIWGASHARSSFEVFSYEKDALTRVANLALREILAPLKNV